MTGKQRYEAMLRGKRVDFVPRIPILMQFAADYIGAKYGAFCSDYRVKVEGNLRCAADFGLDLVGVMSDPYAETQGYGAEIVFLDKGVPQCPHPPLEDTTDLSRVPRPNPLLAARMWNTVCAVRAYQEQTANAYSILGWVEGPAAEAADLRGVNQFLLDLLDDPAWCGELMDRCVDVAGDYARAQVQAGADTLGIGDAICSQISGDLYEQLVLPREQRLVAAIKATGAFVRLHICGNITHLLDGIATLGVDILDVDHMVDLALVRKKVGPCVALAGNIDPVAGILRGTPTAIRDRLRRDYELVGNPFLVNAGCEIPPGTPAANLRALCAPLAWRP
ncbi:MAG: uroporphyrinogen decarboxylase family protein [Kiritimatiellaeota bacterium]|nr:uroporphyrinogen decarboxylase family protein [Kiritimatiellota bacterium]